MAANFIDLIRLRSTPTPDVFLSCSHPEKMGNVAPIAYGGCVVALALQAAFKSIEPDRSLHNFEVYSLLGNYLGPTKTDRPLKLTVSTIRNTRSFATRFVIASQTLDDGTERSTFSATVDFVAPNKIDTERAGGPFQRYSKKPRMQYALPEQLPSLQDLALRKVREGRASKSDADHLIDTVFGLGKKVLLQAYPPQSLHAINVLGLDPLAESDQHELPLPQRFSADWVKSLHSLSSPSPPPTHIKGALGVSNASANACWLAFVMDAALSFIPLTFSKMELKNASAVSSLDCALRFMCKPKVDEWHLREMQTNAGNDCRTYSEAMLWDREGNLVASMTQACILRPHLNKL